MKLNRKLSQQSWLEVKHFVLDDSFGCEPPIWYCPLFPRLQSRLGAKASKNSHERSEFTSFFTSILTSITSFIYSFSIIARRKVKYIFSNSVLFRPLFSQSLTCKRIRLTVLNLPRNHFYIYCQLSVATFLKTKRMPTKPLTDIHGTPCHVDRILHRHTTKLNTQLDT